MAKGGGTGARTGRGRPAAVPTINNLKIAHIAWSGALNTASRAQGDISTAALAATGEVARRTGTTSTEERSLYDAMNRVSALRDTMIKAGRRMVSPVAMRIAVERGLNDLDRTIESLDGTRLKNTSGAKLRQARAALKAIHDFTVRQGAQFST